MNGSKLPTRTLNAVLQDWQDGYSASEIADRNNLKSRSAALGYIHRARMAGDRRADARKDPHAIKAASQDRSKPPASNFRSAAFVTPRPPIFSKAEQKEYQKLLKNPDIPPATLIKTLDLEPHHCRAVYGEPEHMQHCGRERVPGTSWCRAHLQRYSPATAKRLLPVLEPEPELENA